MSSSGARGIDIEQTQGRYFWVALSLVFAAVFGHGLVQMGIPVLYPSIQNEFGLSHAQVGLITSSVAIGYVLMATLSGWFTDSLGAKRMLAISLLATTTLALALLLANSWPVILALMVLVGIASTPLPPATTLAIMEWSPPRIRGLAMGLKQAGNPVGGALTAAMLPALAALLGWRTAAAVTGLLVLPVSIAFLLAYRDASRNRGPARKLDLGLLRNMLRNRPMVATIAWGATFVGMVYIVMSYFMLFSIEALHLSPVAAGSLLAIAHVISVFGRILWGAISDLIRGRRVAAMAIIGFLNVAWMLAVSLFDADTPYYALLLLAVMIGISTFSFHGVLAASVGELADSRQIGTMSGIASAIFHVSISAVPPLFGYLVDISHSYVLGWRAAAALALVITLALLAFGREQRR